MIVPILVTVQIYLDDRIDTADLTPVDRAKLRNAAYETVSNAIELAGSTDGFNHKLKDIASVEILDIEEK